VRKKPKGRKYRNLFARGAAIYYERVVKGRRLRFSTKTSDWDEAAAVRDLWEETTRIGTAVPFLDAPTFGEIAARYLADGMTHLAASTQEDRHWLLRPEGRLARYFGDYRLDDIRRATLLDWWTAEVEQRGISVRTGETYVAALAAVLGYAEDRELIAVNPLDAFRATLRRRNRTQRGRAAGQPSAHVRPIERPEELAAFVLASTAKGGPGHLRDMLQLDAGLRLGEANGLRWGDIRWGRDGNNSTRALVVQQTLARGRHQGGTKSGRSRRVALSRRLRRLLMDWRMAQGQPGDDLSVLPTTDDSNYRRMHFQKVCEAAGIGHRRPKDLRDTFASQLLTAGVQLGYVSQQLGHADVAITARHYARWAGGDAYRRPLEVREGEVPADLLERMATMAVDAVNAEGP